jgi:large subunit ribosomal protein L13
MALPITEFTHAAVRSTREIARTGASGGLCGDNARAAYPNLGGVAGPVIPRHGLTETVEDLKNMGFAVPREGAAVKGINRMPTHIPRADELARRWYVIDAKGKVLGKVATAAARVLTGKTKPIYTPFLDTGDHVVVVNADQVVLTRSKELKKTYRHHTGYLGGLKSRVAKDVRREHPQRLVEEAIRGMLPKTRLGRAMFHKLKVYAGASHPHQAQKPQPLNL